MHDTITTPTALVDAIGRKRVQDALGVGRTAIANRLADGCLPSAWFDVLEALAKETGVSCPRSLFAFVPRHEGDGGCKPASQGQEYPTP